MPGVRALDRSRIPRTTGRADVGRPAARCKRRCWRWTRRPRGHRPAPAPGRAPAPRRRGRRPVRAHRRRDNGRVRGPGERNRRGGGAAFAVPIDPDEDPAPPLAPQPGRHPPRRIRVTREKMARPGWAPDTGPQRRFPAGATVIGARMPLIAYNINLATDRLDVAKKIAAAVRHSSGGLRYVKAMGVTLEDRGIVAGLDEPDQLREDAAASACSSPSSARPGVRREGCWKARSSASFQRPPWSPRPSTTCRLRVRAIAGAGEPPPRWDLGIWIGLRGGIIRRFRIYERACWVNPDRDRAPLSVRGRLTSRPGRARERPPVLPCDPRARSKRLILSFTHLSERLGHAHDQFGPGIRSCRLRRSARHRNTPTRIPGRGLTRPPATAGGCPHTAPAPTRRGPCAPLSGPTTVAPSARWRRRAGDSGRRPPPAPTAARAIPPA